METPTLKQYVIVGNGRFAQLLTGNINHLVNGDKCSKEVIKELSTKKILTGSYEIVAVKTDAKLPQDRVGCIVMAEETSKNCIVIHKAL